MNRKYPVTQRCDCPATVRFPPAKASSQPLGRRGPVSHTHSRPGSHEPLTLSPPASAAKPTLCALRWVRTSIIRGLNPAPLPIGSEGQSPRALELNQVPAASFSDRSTGELAGDYSVLQLQASLACLGGQRSVSGSSKYAAPPPLPGCRPVFETAHAEIKVATEIRETVSRNNDLITTHGIAGTTPRFHAASLTRSAGFRW